MYDRQTIATLRVDSVGILGPVYMRDRSYFTIPVVGSNVSNCTTASF